MLLRFESVIGVVSFRFIECKCDVIPFRFAVQVWCHSTVERRENQEEGEHREVTSSRPR